MEDVERFRYNLMRNKPNCIDEKADCENGFEKVVSTILSFHKLGIESFVSPHSAYDLMYEVDPELWFEPNGHFELLKVSGAA